MARLITALLAVMLVLPALITAASCPVRVAQTKTGSGNYAEYSATAINSGSSAVNNIVLDPASTLKSCSLSKNSDGNYIVPSGLAAGASFSFEYTLKKGMSVAWSSTCAATQTVPTEAKKQTVAPVKPSTSGGRICPTGSWWVPAPLTTWQWQLTGTIDQSVDVQMYDIDLFDATTTVINSLHSKGKVVICYFSTQYESWRSDASLFPSSVIGSALDGWPGENYVDIRASAVRAAINARLDLAVAKGCDGVEPDNIDGYTAKSGFPVTSADQLDFNRYIALQSHARGLSVGLKNDVDQISALQPYFDWALNEQCKQYSECTPYKAFTNVNKAVFNAEYKGTGTTVCPAQNTAKISALVKDLDLTAAIAAQCCSMLPGGCAPASYTCRTSTSKRGVDEETNWDLVDYETTITEVALNEEQSPQVAVPVIPEYLLSAASPTASAFLMVTLAVAIVALFI